MECHEVKMIKIFKGLIADGAQDTIVLHTNDGSTGYRIVKFKLFPKQPGHTVNYESVVQIFSTNQLVAGGTIPASGATVDFSNQELLAAAYYQDNNNDAYPSSLDVVFDKIVFNQDVYVTHTDNSSGGFINYYIELEQINLDLSENTVATLKDIRNTKTQGF
jgi:hypothetical protein